MADYRLDWISENLAVGSAPMSYEALDALKAQGVSAILNLCAEFCDLHWIESEAGFEVYYLPIPDESAPDLGELEKALDWLDEVLYLGKKALIHCRHGIGRTGTVVTAYLLRKGLGSKLAGRKLKGLRSQPANFNQWWFLRKYGRAQRPLVVREPSLETGREVDLSACLAGVEELMEEADRELGPAGERALCGAGHDRCCRRLVVLTLAEAVHLRHVCETQLGRTDRQQIVARALAANGGKGPEDDGAPDEPPLCPLNEYGECMAFRLRPLACRLFDVPGERAAVLRDTLHARAAALSAGLFTALAGAPAPEPPLSFSLPRVVSGRFVQDFFHALF